MSEPPVDYIELNMVNYNDDDVSQLNEWGVWASIELDAREAAIQELRSKLASVVRNLKHLGSFKRTCGEDPHPLDCTLAGRVSHVFGVGMTSAIAMCRAAGEDPEWRSSPCDRFDDHDWELDVENEEARCRRCGATDSVDVLLAE